MVIDRDLDFEKLMEYSIMCLKNVGAHPDIPIGCRWFAQFFFLHSVYTTLLILMVYSILAIEDIKNNIIETCSIASFLVIYFVISFKYFVLVKYKTTFRIMIADIKKDYVKAKTLPKDEREVVLKYALNGRKVTQIWVVLVSATVINFIIVPLLKMLYYYLKGKPKYIQVLDGTNPESLLALNADMLFWGVFLLWIYFIYYSSCLYLGLVPLGPIFMLHLCGQLEILTNRVMKLFPADGSVTQEDRAERLKEIAIHLQSIYDFVDNLKIALKLLYELTLKGTSLISPVVAYVMIEAFSQGQIRMEFAVLFSGILIICSMPCYYGDKLIEKSAELREAVYMCGWEGLYDRKTRSTLLILMTRMERTVAIRSIFVTVNLAALTDVAKQAYALFNLLHAVWD